jgi:hypothetical protein
MKQRPTTNITIIAALCSLTWNGFAEERSAAASVNIRIADGCITAIDANGKRVVDEAAGHDDAAVIQSIIDASGRGRRISLGVGRYVLKRTLLVDRACIVAGEGRETVLVPPQDDFAVRIVKTENSPIRSELAGPDAAEHVLRLEGHLYPVKLSDLCIDGEGQGKGVYLERIFNATLESVFILRTGDGAGLCIGPFAMECVFDDVVVHSCGSVEDKEAAVVISAQESGDPGNNTRFRALEVIFPRWSAVHIGAGEGRRTPRLIFFQQCFFHGTLPFEELPPCDLIHVERCEGARGVVNFTDCRLTNSHDDYSLLRVSDARVTVTGCVLGGGHGRSAIRVEEKGRLIARGNAFQDNAIMSREFALEAAGAQVIFSGNSIESEKDNRLLLTATRSAVITGNQFTLATEHPTIRLADDCDGKGCTNTIIANNSFTETRAKCAIQCDPKSTDRIEIDGNVFGGTYLETPVIRP